MTSCAVCREGRWERGREGTTGHMRRRRMGAAENPNPK